MSVGQGCEGSTGQLWEQNPAAGEPFATMTSARHEILTSDTVNYLIMRYLQESGFSHTAFVFGHESSVARSSIDPNLVPPGSLVSFLQKGMQYLEMEANLDGQVSALGHFGSAIACV